MAIWTVQQLLNDVILQVYEGAPSDDKDLDERQVLFWLSYHLNQLVVQECNRKIMKDEAVPPIYTKRAAFQPIQIETNPAGTPQDRLYVTLSDQVLALRKDAGIVRVSTSDGNIVTRVDLAALNMLLYMPFSMPTAENPVFYRQAQKIYLVGFKDVDAPFEELNVDYIPKQDLTVAALTDEVLVSDETLPLVIDLTVQRAKQEIYGTTTDQTNDGTDTKPLIYHEAIQKPASQQPQQPE